MQNSKEVSIIIVNYGSGQYLKKCLASLFDGLKNISFETIVVNNDKDENLDEISGEFSGIKLIDHKKNVGFGTACNIGAKIAQGKILWFLNPDTEIVSSDIKEALIGLDEDPSIGIVGPKLIDEAGNVQEWIAGKETTFLSIILNNLGYRRDKKVWESAAAAECAWVTGGAMFVRKDIFEKVGGFDENFFMYFEDIDLCKRVRMSGKKVLYFPEVEIRHVGSGSMKTKDDQKKDYYAAQKYYFKKRYGTFPGEVIEVLRKSFKWLE